MKIVIIACLIAMTLAEPPSYRQEYQNDKTYYFAKQQEEAPYQASGWKPDGPAFELPQKQQQQQAPVQPQGQYGAPVKPSKEYGGPVEPQKQYGAPAKPSNQYGSPQKQFTTQLVPERQISAQFSPQKQYGAPAQPSNQYGSPAQPSNPYGSPAQSSNQYGAPAQPSNQYGGPVQSSQNQYGAPVQSPQNQYGGPVQFPQQYGAPEYTTIEPVTATDYEESTNSSSGVESQAEPVDSVNDLEEIGDVDESKKESGEYYVALPDGRLQRVQYVSSQDIEAMKYFAKIRAENVEPLRGPVYAYQPLQKLQFAPSKLAINAEQPVVAIRETSPKNLKIQASPAKLEVQPLAAEIPSGIVAPVSSSYTTYTANYQLPEQRFLISL
ncbi:pro-resilin-like [Aphidius gifuensis]|uniref:pro-resilin-like n=1 Tax=Aphidius gifuensis TaxID=684658 RepID=UPI001CDC284F|nr:pro-resilin-like [Aphidius gifuensis]